MHAFFCGRARKDWCGRFFAIGLLLATGLAQAQSGPAFSKPDLLAPVPAGWETLPVQHRQGEEAADLVIGLGQQSWPILHDFIARYAREKSLRILVKPGTCGITAGRLLKKRVDIGAFCCPPGRNDRLPGLEFHSLGISPIALIVHPDNPLREVTLKQARALFAGQLDRWTELDTATARAADRPALDRMVQPVGRLHCKIRPGHWRLLLNDGDAFSPRLFEVGVIPDMISQVAQHRGAIGWETPYMLQYHAARGRVRTLRIDGHAPEDTGALLRGDYPLYRTYHLTTWRGDHRGARLARELVRALRGEIEKRHRELVFVPPSQLRRAGWRFRGEELVGPPPGSAPGSAAP